MARSQNNGCGYCRNFRGSYFKFSYELPNIFGSTGAGNIIFRDQILNWSVPYKSLKIQVPIQDIGSNACFIEAEERNDYLDAKTISGNEAGPEDSVEGTFLNTVNHEAETFFHEKIHGA